jgi:hypothetical protein
MKWLQQLKRKVYRKNSPPILTTEWGQVSEGLRRQAAENLRNDPVKRAKVIEMIGEAEARRKYPEAFE